MTFSYAWQKSYEALTSLISNEELDKRLMHAGWALSMFPLEEVPPEIQRLALLAQRAFSQYPGTHLDGTISGLIQLLPEQRKLALRDKVVTLYTEVCKLCGMAEKDKTLYRRYDRISLEGSDKWEFLYWLLPTGCPAAEKEQYVSYAKHWLPNFPDDVLCEWPGRHGEDGIRPWSYLPLEELRFTEVFWDYQQLQRIQTLNPSFSGIGPDSMGSHYVEREGDWLSDYMRSHGTWPAPIVVFDSPAAHSGPFGIPIPAGPVLIEGHSRLCRMLNLPAEQRADTHRVWLAELPSELALKPAPIGQ